MRLALALILLAAACAPTTPSPPPSPAALPTPPAAQAPRAAPARVVDGDFAFRGKITQGGLAVGRAPRGTRELTLDGRRLRVDPDGRFLIGFGRDAPGFAVVEAKLADGTIVRVNLRIAPREWKIERIPSLRQNLAPNPAYEKLRTEELDRIKAARAINAQSSGWTEQFGWPVKGRISGIYGSQRILGGVPMNFHGGFDIAAPSGTPIVAPASGVVVLAGPPKFSLEGNLLMLDHGNGLVSSFLHLSRVDVALGDRVAKGQRIGAIGMTGRATGPHLHWGMSLGATRVDPQLLLPPMDAP